MKKRGKLIKLGVALLLLPFCYGGTRGLLEVIGRSGHADTFWAAFLAGAASWVVCFLVLPKPMWLYVFGHELAHAVGTWICGGRVSRFKVSSKGGSVTTDRANFLVALAPYYFPLYSLVAAVGYAVADRWWDVTAVRPCYHWVLGVTYAFHVTLNLYVLRARQSDLANQGYVFSMVVIWLANVVVLIASVPFLTDSAEWFVGFRFSWLYTVELARLCLQWLGLGPG